MVILSLHSENHNEAIRIMQYAIDGGRQTLIVLLASLARFGGARMIEAYPDDWEARIHRGIMAMQVEQLANNEPMEFQW